MFAKPVPLYEALKHFVNDDGDTFGGIHFGIVSVSV